MVAGPLWEPDGENASPPAQTSTWRYSLVSETLLIGKYDCYTEDVR